jgi:hypothetical protein
MYNLKNLKMYILKNVCLKKVKKVKKFKKNKK